MQVENVSFGARYVKSATIKKCSSQGMEKHRIVMVELSPFEINDVKCINDLNVDWGGRRSLSYNLLNSMYRIFADFSAKCNSRFFALTQQKDNFKNLEPEKILSVAQTTDITEKIVSLDLIETMSEESHTAKDPKFKHIGQAMIDNIKFLNFGRDILAETDEENEPFCTKNGFEKVEVGSDFYIFKSAKYF